MPDGTWSCARCETNNAPDAVECRRCGGSTERERPQHRPGAGASTVNRPEPGLAPPGAPMPPPMPPTAAPPLAGHWPQAGPAPAPPEPILGTAPYGGGWGAPPARASRSGKTGAVLLTALAAVVVLIVGGKYLVSNGGSAGTGPGSTASRGTGDSGAAISTGSASTTEAPTDLTPGQVPGGYRSVTGAGGIALAVPEAWPEAQAGTVPGTEQVGPDGGVDTFIRYGALAAPDTDLLSYLETGEQTNPNIATDFARIHLDPISYPGADEGYDWEFTFTKNGQPRHVRACYWTYGGQLYLVYGSGPAADWAGFESTIDVAIHSAAL